MRHVCGFEFELMREDNIIRDILEDYLYNSERLGG